jgi:SAM-dependent methyltransferase
VRPGRLRQGVRRRVDILGHRGQAVECPLCGGRFSRFRDAWNRANAICWRCGAHERHRQTWIELTRRRPELLDDAGSLLHFAPEHALERRLRGRAGLRYVTADLDPSLGDLQLDLTALDLPDGAFDAILCSHVLEHVADDRAAMSELRRVTAPGGWVLVMVLLDHGRTTTYEDPSIVTPGARTLAFWQHDHVRLYALDIADRLREAGFDRVERVRTALELGPGAARRYGILIEEELYLCSVV